MKFLPLFDNPLFLKNWRERLRPQYLASALIISAFVILLIVVGNYANRDTLSVYNYELRRSVPIFWVANILYQIACFEGVVILLFGTISAYRNTAQENSAGTIDFHRASPINRFDQTVGLVLGSVILEWIVFGLIAFVSCVGFVLCGFSLGAFIAFHVSLVLTALFLHILAVWAGLFAMPKKQGMGVLGTLAALYFFWMVIAAFSFMSSQVSAFYHATWVPTYSRLHQELLGSLANPSSWEKHSMEAAREAVFYGMRMAPFLLQMLVQVPLALLAITGIRRRLASGENGALSKSQFMALYILVLFYYLGSVITLLLLGNNFPYHHFDQSAVCVMTIYLLYGFMFAGVLVATPDHLQFIRGLARARKTGRARLSLSDDKSSNVLWTGVFSLVTILFWSCFAFVLRFSVDRSWLVLMVILSQIVAFASAWEAFRLSRFHQKKIYFWTGLAILWVGLPMLGFALVGDHSEARFPFFAASPLFNVGPMIELVESAGKNMHWVFQKKAVHLLVINLLIASVSTLLAERERSRVERDQSGQQ